MAVDLRIVEFSRGAAGTVPGPMQVQDHDGVVSQFRSCGEIG